MAKCALHRQGTDEVAIAGRAMAYRASATVAFATAVASARVGAAAAARTARVPKTRKPCIAFLDPSVPGKSSQGKGWERTAVCVLSGQ